MRIFSFLLVFMLTCSHAFADQVTLKNGDRLSGEILKSDEKSLTLKTEFAGEVKIDWSAVTNVDSSQDMTVGLKGKNGFRYREYDWGECGHYSEIRTTGRSTEIHSRCYAEPCRASRISQEYVSRHDGRLEGWPEFWVCFDTRE